MQKTLKFIVPAIVAVVILGIGGGVYYKQYAAEQKERAARDALNQSFEDFLNKFLQNVHAGMIDYKQERKVLVEATGPRNLSDPVYVEENYQLVQMLIPSLRKRMANVIKIFEDAETEIAGLVEGQPENVQTGILKKWADMKQAQGQVYIGYFAAENDILTAYEDLMRFYYNKRETFKVVPETHIFTFKNPEDEAEAERLQQHIKDLYAQQDELLKQDSDKQP
ncbi:MAG: hypothetical protein DYH13_05305 [Alphaproteobacteria bacterium PRO2]|nr:hypothetical protein [Alphaproteobacteria bacterium PRO2]